MAHPEDRSEDGLAAIATEVIFEDSEIRVWDQHIAAGATLGKHRHDCDYVLITVRGGGPLAVEFLEGTGGSLGDRLELRTKRGDATFVRRGHVETARNDGDAYRAILVELKRDT